MRRTKHLRLFAANPNPQAQCSRKQRRCQRWITLAEFMAG